jgi:hypothetical protein
MKLTSKLWALGLAFGLFAAGVVGAAAFLPLKQLGRTNTLASHRLFPTTHLLAPASVTDS